MYHVQTSLFYDLQELVRNSSLLRKYEFVEQYFARLGDREAEQTTHYALKTVRNQMTIAHLTASLIGVAAAILLKQPDKIRCYQTFADPPKLRRTG